MRESRAEGTDPFRPLRRGTRSRQDPKDEGGAMKVIKVERKLIPSDWTEEHLRVLEHGHERGVVSNATAKRTKVAEKVLGFASRCGVGVSVMGGFTFVDIDGRNGNGPVQFEVVG